MRRWLGLSGIVLSAVSVLGSAAMLAESSNAKTTEVLKPVVSSTAHAALFGLSFERDRGVAVGVKGVKSAVLESSDGGATWAAVAVTPSHAALLSVATKGGRAIAVGLSGVVMISQRKGEWKRVESGSTSRLLSVDLNASGLAVAAGEFGAVIVSKDGGRSWARGGPNWAAFVTDQNLSAGEPMLYAVSVSDAGQITLAGEFGLMIRSDDSGATWRVLRSPVPGASTINAIFLQPAGSNSYAVGQRGELLVSVDGGETWERRPTNTQLNFLGVSASPGGNVVISGMRVMYRSINRGETWDRVTAGDAALEWYQSVCTEPASGRIYAVGHSGRIVQIGS